MVSKQSKRPKVTQAADLPGATAPVAAAEAATLPSLPEDSDGEDSGQFARFFPRGPACMSYVDNYCGPSPEKNVQVVEVELNVVPGASRVAAKEPEQQQQDGASKKTRRRIRFAEADQQSKPSKAIDQVPEAVVPDGVQAGQTEVDEGKASTVSNWGMSRIQIPLGNPRQYTEDTQKLKRKRRDMLLEHLRKVKRRMEWWIASLDHICWLLALVSPFAYFWALYVSQVGQQFCQDHKISQDQLCGFFAMLGLPLYYLFSRFLKPKVVHVARKCMNLCTRRRRIYATLTRGRDLQQVNGRESTV